MSAGAKLWVCVDPTAERKLWVPAKGDATGILQVYDATSFASLATLLARIGDPSAHTLTSLTAKWGNIARSLDLILGARWDGAGDLGTDIAALLANVDLEGATSLADKLTLARAGYLDELAAANMPTDIGLIIAALGAWPAERGTDGAALAANWTAALATALGSYTAALATALGNYTAIRAGYLDNLSAGAVAQAATALTNATWTDALAAILLNFTAARIGYMDHLIGTVTTGTYSLTNDVNQQDAIVIAANTQIVDLELDMVNLTQANTVREYVQTDGANYRQISARVFPADFDTLTKAAILSFEQKNALYKVTLQASVLEGVARNIPWRQMVRSLV